MSRPSRRPPPPRHTVAVEIAGEKHVLRSDVPPEYTRRVAAHVDATIRALPGFQTLEPFRAATLAALSITDELLRARDEIRRLRDEADQRTHRLADVLEAAEEGTGDRGQGTASRRRPGAASPVPEEIPPPLPDVLPPEPSPPPPPEPHPAWAAAPVEKPAPPPSLFGDEPELNFPPPEE
ncbi:MAG TPA: cell division protein ZapA [Longimicrobiaceae bacterium]|nr:cell division protein ZapA [Longimicrobiaceae bacterium]